MFCDFDSTTPDPAFSEYNGLSQGYTTGVFSDTHVEWRGDGWLRLKAYQDRANGLKSWQATAALLDSVNNWVGAGLQTVLRFPPETAAAAVRD